MKILMTGSHGFVGSNLIESLAPNYTIIRWDVREDRPLPGCDAVIHLAGLAHDTKHATEDEKYYEVNTELTKKIYDKFLESGARKFIFFSSIKAQECDTLYAKSKRLAEDYILDKVHGSGFKVNGCKRTYILRPCMIHGKGNKGNLNLLVKWVRKGWPWPLAAFENKRSFASMGNVTFIVDKLLNSEVESGIYNVCDDEPVSTNELISIICRCMGRKTHLWRIPKVLMKGLARVGDILRLPLNTERLGKLTDSYVVDNSKIKKALGIIELPVKAQIGMNATINSMINQQ